MAATAPTPRRWVGLDSHKHYLVAVGVDADLAITLPQQRVDLPRVQQ